MDIKPKLSIHKHTLTQIKEKRDKRLCFRCNGKWNPVHKFGGPKLFLIEKLEDKEEKSGSTTIRDLIDWNGSQVVNEKLSKGLSQCNNYEF